MFHVSQSAKRSGSYLTVIRNCSSLCQEKHKSSILARRSWMECNRQNVCCEKRTGRDGTDWTRPPRPRCSEGWAPDSFSFLFFSFAKLNWLWELKMQVSARQWVNTPSDEVKALPVYRRIQDGLRLMSGSSPVSAGFPPSQSPTSRTRVYCSGSGMHVINQKVITLRVKTNIYKQMKMLM